MAGLTEVEYQEHLRWEEEQKRKHQEALQRQAAEARETKIHGPAPKYPAPADVDPWVWSGMDPKEQKAELVRRKMADPEFQQRMAALGPEKLQAQAQQIARNRAAKREEDILRYRRENPYEAARDEQLSSGERLTSAVNHHQKRLQDSEYDAKFGAGLDRLGRGTAKRTPGVGLIWSIGETRDRTDITKKISAGEATPDEYLRLGMYIAEEERAAGRTGFAKAVDIASYLPGFATEFMLSGGGAAVGRAAAQRGVLAGAKRLGVSAGTRGVPALARGAGFLGAAAGQAAHPVMWGRAADTFLKKRDPGFKLKGRKASRGYDVVVNEHAKSIGKHAYEAMWSHYIEIMSERLGAPMMKGLGKASGVGWLASKLPDNHLKRVGADVLKRSGEFAQKTGLSFNPIEEYLEEVAGDKLKSSRFTADEEGHLSGLVGKFLADPLNKAVQTSLWKETGPMLGAFAMSGVAFGAVPSMQYGRSAEIREEMDLREKALQQAAQQQAAGAAEGGDAGYKAFNEARKSRLAQEAGIEALRGEEQELAAEKRREEATPLDIALQGIRKEAVESTAGIYARDELNEFQRTAKGSDTAAYEKAKKALWEKLAVGGEKSLSRKDISTLFEGKEIPPDLRSKHGRDAFLQGVRKLSGLVQTLEKRGDEVHGLETSLGRLDDIGKEPAPEEPSDAEEVVEGKTEQSLEMLRAPKTPPEEYVVDTKTVKARFKTPAGILRKEVSKEAASHIATGHTVPLDTFKERPRGELREQTEIYLHQKTGAETPQQLLDWYKEKHPELKDIQIGGLVLDRPADAGSYKITGKATKENPLEGAMIYLTPEAGLVVTRHEIEELLQIHRGYVPKVEVRVGKKHLMAKDMERYEHDDFNRFAYLHRALVRDALREGKEVPEEVLADYPDLAEEYRPGAAQEPSEAPVAVEAAEVAIDLDSAAKRIDESMDSMRRYMKDDPSEEQRDPQGLEQDAEFKDGVEKEIVALANRYGFTVDRNYDSQSTYWDINLEIDGNVEESFQVRASNHKQRYGGTLWSFELQNDVKSIAHGLKTIEDEMKSLAPTTPAASKAAEAKEELTDWKEILRRAKAAGVSAQIPKGETKADLAARVIAAEEAAKEEPPAEEEIEDTPDIEVREIEEEAPKPKKTGVKKTKSQKAAIKRFRGRQSAARTAVEKADAQELEQWEYDNPKKKPSLKTRWWKYSLSRTPTAETETKADVVIGRVELKNKAERKETRLSLDKIAQLADRVPEFAYNPVFVVEERRTTPRNTYAKDTAPLKLIYRNGVQFIINPALFNLEQKDLAPGMTVGINLEDLFIKRRTEAEVVGKLFRDSPPVARAGQAVRVSSKKNVVSFSHTDPSKRATASRIGKHRWRSDDKELQAKLDSINWVTEGFAAEAKEEAPKPEKPKKGAKKTKPKKKAEPTAAPEAAEPKKGEPAPKEKSQEQLAEEKLMPLAEMKEEQAKLVEKLGTSEATAVRVVHSKDPLAEKYGSTFLKVVNNPAVKSIKYAENPDLSGDVAAGMAPLPHGYLVELAPGWITREGRTYVMLDYPASAQRDLALNPRNREPLIHKEGDGEYEVGEGFSDAEEIVSSPSRWKKAVDDFMKWVSGVFTEKQPVTQRAKARASLYRRYFQVGGLLGKEAYTRIQQSRGKIEGDMQVVYQSLGDLNRLLVETGWVTKTWKKPSTKFFDASELLDHNQRFRLSRLSRTKLTEMDSVAKAMDVPKELLPPIKRIREHLNKLSGKVYEMLKKDLGGLEADEDFVKRYGDVLDLAMGQHGIYLTRTFELFDNPERGEKVRKEYPDLYKTFKEEYGKVDRNRRVKKLAREMLRRSHEESKDFFGTLKDRVEERMEEYRIENPDVKKGSERYKRRKRAIRNLFVEEHRRDIKALAELKTQPLKPEELEGHMNILLSPKRAKPALVRESLGRVDMNIFIMRKLGDHRYHQMLRKILGEYYNRFELNTVRTAERLSSIVAQQEAQDFLWEYAKKNKWVALDNKNRKSKQPVGEAHIRVSDSIEFGPFRGAYVTPEFEMALKDEFGSGFGHVKPLQGFLNYTVFKIWGRMMGSARFSKTLLSSTVQVRNWAANGSISFVNGHMWSLNKTLGENFRAFYMSGKATLETHFPGGKDRGEEKIDNQTIREHIKELMANGVVFDSPSNDLADMIRAAWDKPIMSILHDGPNLESASSIEKAVRTAKRGVVRVLRGSAGFYRFGDDFWKVLGYSSELAALREAFPDSASIMKVAGKPGYPAFEGDMKLSKNRDKWIKTAAANRIRDMYPTFGNAANWVKAIRWFPLVGTFPTYFAELVRTQYIDFWKIANRDLRSGIPALRSRAIWRVTRWASANFATGLVAKHALRALVAMMPGISAVGGDDEEELRDLLAPWSKNSTIFAWKNDKTGEVFTIDLSYVLPYGRLTDAGRALYSGDTVGAKLGGATMEGMGDIFTEDMVFTLLSEAWSGETLEGRKVFDKNDPARDRWVRSLLHAWGAWEPGLVNTSVRTVMGMGDVPSFTGRKYSPLIELIAAMTGQRITKVEVARSFGFKVSEFSNVLRTDKRILEKVARSEFKPILGFISGSVNQVEKRLPIMERQRERHFGQMHNYVSTARSLGVSDREITQILKRNGLNMELISAVKSGNYIPYEPSDNMAKQIFGSYNGREKLVKIREHRRKMWVEERERRASGKPLLGARPND